jgi:Uma2 family endonuclease
MALTEQLTLDESLRLPEEKPALEYERGVITQKMAPMGWHSRLQFHIGMRFEQHGHPDPIFTAYTGTRVTWIDERKSYVPAAIAYFTERAPEEPDGYIVDRLTVPPDVAVEIWSEGQVLGDQIERCRWYVSHDVRVALLVHPHRRLAWAFRPGEESGPLSGTDVVDLSDLSDGLSFTVDELFTALRSRRARSTES